MQTDTLSPAEEQALLKAFAADEPRAELLRETDDLKELIAALENFQGDRVDVASVVSEAEDALDEIRDELKKLGFDEDGDELDEDSDAEDGAEDDDEPQPAA